MKVGDYKDLVQRIEGNNVLVRAINDYELGQLVKTGAENFCFHRGTGYEKFYGNMVSRQAQLRSGTVIVYALQVGDIGEKFALDRGSDDWATCKNDFNVPVEVYNIKGRDWEGILSYVKMMGL